MSYTTCLSKFNRVGCLGDFNEIMQVSEKKWGVSTSVRKCGISRERIDSCNLMDLGFVGHRLTWRGPIFHGGGRINECLDKSLYNYNWILQLLDSYVKVLPGVELYNHHPILIHLQELNTTEDNRRFYFESVWLLEESYNALMMETCRND